MAPSNFFCGNAERGNKEKFFLGKKTIVQFTCAFFSGENRKLFYVRSYALIFSCFAVVLLNGYNNSEEVSRKNTDIYGRMGEKLRNGLPVVILWDI